MTLRGATISTGSHFIARHMVMEDTPRCAATAGLVQPALLSFISERASLRSLSVSLRGRPPTLPRSRAAFSPAFVLSRPVAGIDSRKCRVGEMRGSNAPCSSSDWKSRATTPVSYFL